ncbi:MAG: UDP-N-acetylmuramate--L-alanine ligase, partial [Candidatus Melainabacteria bacterium]|nr:UDP-N-acetylmuramate--L-alanine ligase [Candidatus Melainabacteria bacterium]
MNQAQNNHQSQKQNLKAKKLHFIGIGGIGMSALARYFNLLGKDISGSDKELSATICALKEEGINNIWTPHADKELSKINPDYIIYSTAVNETNPEIKWAKENNKIILHRSELLELATKEKKLIAVSGTHGKTSTTALIYDTLEKNGYSPSCIIGGILNSKRSNSVLG